MTSYICPTCHEDSVVEFGNDVLYCRNCGRYWISGEGEPQHGLEEEEYKIIEVIKAARVIQEYLWGDINTAVGFEEFRRMFRKRVIKLDEVTLDNPYWKIEAKKRLLQVAAIAINVMTKLDFGEIGGEENQTGVPSNLTTYGVKLQDVEEG